MKTWLIASALLFCLAPTGCRTAAEGRTVRIATDANFPPFHYVDSKGRITGHDVELARAVLEEAGYRVVVKKVPFGELLPGLLRREHDVVAATVGIIPERQNHFLFSEPYFETCQAILHRAEDSVKSWEDLENKRVGAEQGTTSERALRSKLPYALAIILPEGKSGIEAMENGTIEALVADEFDLIRAARNAGKKWKLLPHPLTIEWYGFVFRPDQIELRDAFNRSFSALQSNGKTMELRERFGLLRDVAWPVDFPDEWFGGSQKME